VFFCPALTQQFIQQESVDIIMALFVLHIVEMKPPNPMVYHAFSSFFSIETACLMGIQFCYPQLQTQIMSPTAVLCSNAGAKMVMQKACLAAGKVQKMHARDGQVKCYKVFIPVIEIAQVCAKFLVDSILEEINMLLLPQMDSIAYIDRPWV
jgi:hypothetical protein